MLEHWIKEIIFMLAVMVEAIAAILIGVGAVEAAKGYLDRFIRHVLTRLACELRMNEWRLRLGNRIAEDGVAIGHVLTGAEFSAN